MISGRFAARAMAVTLGLSLAAPALLAKPKHDDKGKVEATRLDVPALKKQLAGSEQEVVAALGTIGDSGNPEGAPLVNDVLARGGTQTIVEEALKTAGKLKSPALSTAVAPYVQHRTPEIRRAAARALVKTKGPAAVAALSKALRSEDASVRGTAATGLGELGARESIKGSFQRLRSRRWRSGGCHRAALQASGMRGLRRAYRQGHLRRHADRLRSILFDRRARFRRRQDKARRSHA